MNVTVRASTASTAATGAQRARIGAAKSGLRIDWKVNTTSSAVSGLPSEKRRPSRRVKISVVASGAVQLSASSGTTCNAGVGYTRPE